ncbi:MAG: hypothetical protein R3E01_30850 [Pirellulaceae bacterium]
MCKNELKQQGVKDIDKYIDAYTSRMDHTMHWHIHKEHNYNERFREIIDKIQNDATNGFPKRLASGFCCKLLRDVLGLVREVTEILGGDDVPLMHPYRTDNVSLDNDFAPDFVRQIDDICKKNPVCYRSWNHDLKEDHLPDAAIGALFSCGTSLFCSGGRAASQATLGTVSKGFGRVG